MRSKLQKIGLVSAGVLLGAALTLNYSAVADREAKQALPLEELRTFARPNDARAQAILKLLPALKKSAKKAD